MDIDHSSGLPERFAGGLPPTQWSVILSASGPDLEKAAAALQRLCEMYRPAIVRWFSGRVGSFEDAEDEAQKFLGRRFSGDYLGGFERRPGVRFRSWLLTCLRHQLFDRRPASFTEPLEDGEAVMVVGSALAADALLDGEIARQIDGCVRLKVRKLWQGKDREHWFEALEPLLFQLSVAPGSYAGPAGRCGLTEKEAQRACYDLRQEYSSAFAAEVRELCLPGDHAGETRYLRGLLLRDHSPA